MVPQQIPSRTKYHMGVPIWEFSYMVLLYPKNPIWDYDISVGIKRSTTNQVSDSILSSNCNSCLAKLIIPGGW